MKKQEGKSRPRPDPVHKVDHHHDDAKRDEPLGRFEIAPAKPLWPSKK